MGRISSYRRVTQLATLAAIFIIPALNLLEITFIKGTFYSMDIGDLALADPLAIFQAVLVSKTFTLVMLTSLVVPLFIVLIFGRVWCSWFCPYYLLTEAVAGLRKRFAVFGCKPYRRIYGPGSTSRQNTIRYGLLGLGLLLAGIAGIPLLNLISAPGILSAQALVLVKFRTLTFELFFILLILILEFFFYKYWCRLLCPTGVFLSLFQRRSGGMQVVKLYQDCSQCHTCIRICPMQINPMTEGDNPLCHNCGLCVDNCPDNHKRDTLKFRFR